MKPVRQHIDAVNGHRRFSLRTGVVLGGRLPYGTSNRVLSTLNSPRPPYVPTPACDGVSWDFVRLS